MKKQFSIALIAISLLLASASCKKDKVPTGPENLDLTKYYITGEGMSPYATSYILMFQPNAQCYFTGKGGAVSNNLEYVYQNNTLNIANGHLTFTISGSEIISINKPDVYRSYHLERIPDTDAFAGKTFRGTVATNGLDNGKSCLIKFTTGRFTVSIDGFGQTGSGEDYTLQNNGIATATTGNEGRLHLMSIGQGKLYYSQFNAANNTHYYGTLTQQ